MIRVEGVTKVYRTRSGPKLVLDDVSFDVSRGDALAIMGRNGAGKSTLTRMMSGIEFPTRGKVWRDMTVSWPLGYFGAFQASLTGADNTRFIARIYGVPIKETLEFVEDFASLGPYMNMPVRTYSAGMKARLSFGVSLAINFECYIVDEVTGAGDHRFAERSKAALHERRENGALVMISHDPHTLLEYCSRGALLDGGKLTFFNSVQEMIDAYHAL